MLDPSRLAGRPTRPVAAANECVQRLSRFRTSDTWRLARCRTARRRVVFVAIGPRRPSSWAPAGRLRLRVADTCSLGRCRTTTRRVAIVAFGSRRPGSWASISRAARCLRRARPGPSWLRACGSAGASARARVAGFPPPAAALAVVGEVCARILVPRASVPRPATCTWLAHWSVPRCRRLDPLFRRAAVRRRVPMALRHE
jgi:hypothetical protein